MALHLIRRPRPVKATARIVELERMLAERDAEIRRLREKLETAQIASWVRRPHTGTTCPR